MADVFFISKAYLEEMSVINENTDWKILKPTIIMVQDIYLQKILGTPLYNDLKTKLIADITLATYPNEKALIDNYISKALVWYIKMEATMEFKFRYMNKGVMVKNSDNSQPADTDDLKYLMDKWRVNAEMYAQLLTDYLIMNTATFPKYLEVDDAGMVAKNKNYTSGIYLSDYGKNNQSEESFNRFNYWRKGE
jgi:hypothetical protein